ncbi:MAG: AraC family transcriptional regulator [Lachnospiraceae bacterium]|nr:AraC family transcriptional regulator [Lachnospiraceae bacterium]
MKAEDRVVRNKHYHCLEYDHDQDGDIFLVACGMEKCDPGVTYGPELRDCYHLHAVLSGRGTLKVRGMEFHPHFGQFFLLKDNEVVEYTADEKDPWEYCWVTFNGSLAPQLVREIGFEEDVYCVDSAYETREFYDLICRMHEKPEMNYINDLRRRGILLECLALAMEATETAEKKATRRRERPTDEYVAKAIDFIHYNYATIQVADIISFIGFTRSYFSTVFRKKTGQSLQDYLMQVRISEARRLLKETDLPVREIAFQTGYDDPLNFSRMFRKVCGVSPTQFRNSTAYGDQKK